MPVQIDRLQYVALRAPSPSAAAEFATAKLGFELAHVDDAGSHYLKAKGPDPYSLVYVGGAELGLDHLGYLVADEAALDSAPAAIEAAGVVADLVARPRWEKDAAVRLRTPSGYAVELSTGVNLTAPPSHILPSPRGDGPAPLAADHVGLGAPDFEAEEEFWGKAFGLLHSSRIFAPDGGPQVMSFLRTPGGHLYHCVVAVRSPVAELHHLQFSLKDVEAFREAEQAMKAAGVDIRWGPLRHGAGHNVAMYFQDGAGYWIEYSAEEEVILDDDNYDPRNWDAGDPHAVDEWGTGPPPAELMGGPPAP